MIAAVIATLAEGIAPKPVLGSKLSKMLSELVRGLRLAGGMMRTARLILMRILEGEMILLRRLLAQLDLDFLKDLDHGDAEKCIFGKRYVPRTMTLSHCTLPLLYRMGMIILMALDVGVKVTKRLATFELSLGVGRSYGASWSFR